MAKARGFHLVEKMTYKPGIPLLTDTFGTMQSEVSTNFTVLNNVYGEDHIAYDSGTLVGYHDKVTLVDKSGSAPSAVASANVLYSDTINSKIVPVVKNANGSVAPIAVVAAYAQLTYNSGTWAIVANSNYNLTVNSTSATSVEFTFTTNMNGTNYLAMMTPFVLSNGNTVIARPSTILTTGITFTFRSWNGSAFGTNLGSTTSGEPVSVFIIGALT
jgi:hypothetical protein